MPTFHRNKTHPRTRPNEAVYLLARKIAALFLTMASENQGLEGLAIVHPKGQAKLSDLRKVIVPVDTVHYESSSLPEIFPNGFPHPVANTDWGLDSQASKANLKALGVCALLILYKDYSPSIPKAISCSDSPASF